MVSQLDERNFDCFSRQNVNWSAYRKDRKVLQNSSNTPGPKEKCKCFGMHCSEYFNLRLRFGQQISAFWEIYECTELYKSFEELKLHEVIRNKAAKRSRSIVYI